MFIASHFKRPCRQLILRQFVSIDSSSWVQDIAVIGILLWAARLQFSIVPNLRSDLENETNQRQQENQKNATTIQEQHNIIQKLTSQKDEGMGKQQELTKRVEHLQHQMGRMRDSRTRGKDAEVEMHKLLNIMKQENLVKDIQIEPRLNSGDKPDAVLELNSGRKMVVDCKSPLVLDLKSSDEVETAQTKYVESLKVMINDMRSKMYHQKVDNALPFTWIFLPDDPYDLVLRPEGDSTLHEIFEYGKKNNIRIVGPEGLRSDLQLYRLQDLITDQIELQKSDEIMAIFSKHWGSIYASERAITKILREQVKKQNELLITMNQMDAELCRQNGFGQGKRIKPIYKTHLQSLDDSLSDMEQKSFPPTPAVDPAMEIANEEVISNELNGIEIGEDTIREEQLEAAVAESDDED